MLPNVRKIEPPTDDKRWRIVDAVMRRNGYARHALIETLHSVQESFGFLDEESLQYVSASLRVPLSSVYGVSTFYHLFSLKPAGKHTCVMCTGTACYINGIPKMLEDIETAIGIRPGETTADDLISLMTARCLGACGIAPVAVFDGEVMGKVSSEKALAKIEGWQEAEHDQ
jgi:bidirectional [NiFe] hydrogenase diaphorase subunit